MARDNEFDLEMGRIGRQERGFLQRVLHAKTLAGGGRKSAFQGNRKGRGSGIGRVLASRDRYGALRSRRVILKARIVKLAGKGMAAARAHLRYLQRDGVTRDGEPGILYDAKSEGVDSKAFIERGDGDRHQFRFIVSPEDGALYDDLKPFVRRLMAQMEKDLGTKLDWVAVDHFNTGHPHTHVIVRGKDERGQDLLIAREYVSHGLRERAAEIVTLDLGRRTDLEIEGRLRAEMDQERFTSLDRRLLQDIDEHGLVYSGSGAGDNFSQSLRAGRLQKLKRLGLAAEEQPGHWRLSGDLELALRRMGERGDIIATMHRQMRERAVERAPAGYAIYDPHDPAARPIVGRVIAQGFADEIEDRRYLILDGLDGHPHYVETGRADPASPILDNMILRIAPKAVEVREVDRTIAEVAMANHGRYSVDLHLAHDRTATAAFAEAHVRRLEAMRRLSGSVTREPDGSWTITADHLERAAAYERAQARLYPVTVETLSRLDLDGQIGAHGPTWLDRELTAKTPTAIRDSGFGREAREALEQRRRWLIREDLAREEDGRTLYRAGLLAQLRRRDLARAADQLTRDMGLTYREARPGSPVEGVYRRRLDLVSGPYAVIAGDRDFQLVPWRPVLERSLGQPVSGIMRVESVSWTIGRQRGGPSIS